MELNNSKPLEAGGVDELNDIQNRDINDLKVEALAQGKFTDCVFLVGSDNEIQEEIHAIKGMMMMACGFMQGLFRNTAGGPIKLADVDPKIFKLVVEFIHLGHLHTPVSNKILPDLMKIADRYLIDSLKIKCISMLEQSLSVDTVWSVLKKILKLPDHLRSESKCCDNILIRRTEDCLNHRTFLHASSKSVNYLLKQETLDIKSEWQLVNYCVKWAQSRSDPKKAFRKIIGRLRLLTLTTEQLLELPNFFAHKELQIILKVSLNPEVLVDLPESLCHETSSRKFRQSLKRKSVGETGKHQEYSVAIVPEFMTNKSHLELEEHEKYRTEVTVSNILLIQPKVDIYLTRCTFEGKVLDPPQIYFDQDLQGYVSMAQLQDYDVDIEILKNGENFLFYSKENVVFGEIDKGFHVPEPKPIPKGTVTKLEFKFAINSPSIFRNVSCRDVNSYIQRSMDTEVFESVQFEEGNGVPIFIHEIKYVVGN